MYYFRLSVEEFWDLTPAQYAELAKRKEEDDKKQDWRIGVLVSTVINMFAGKDGARVAPLEVMGWGKDGTRKMNDGQSPQETRVRMRLLEAAQKLSGGRKG
jgi:hypothetical protein